MRALVTGGGGFLGKAIVKLLLARGDRVRSFSRATYPELVVYEFGQVVFNACAPGKRIVDRAGEGQVFSIW